MPNFSTACVWNPRDCEPMWFNNSAEKQRRETAWPEITVISDMFGSWGIKVKEQRGGKQMSTYRKQTDGRTQQPSCYPEARARALPPAPQAQSQECVQLRHYARKPWGSNPPVTPACNQITQQSASALAPISQPWRQAGVNSDMNGDLGMVCVEHR